MTVEPIVDANQVAMGDAIVPGDATVIATVDAGPLDGAVATVPPDAGIDKGKEARKLLEAAQTALNEGRPEEALDKIDASLKLRKPVRAHLVRAQILQRLNMVNEALDAVDRAIEGGLDNAPSYELRGRILWAAGRKDEARFAFERFLEIETDGPKAEKIRELLRENR
jgi:tetratricopeptide (TPR) repeat protein